MFDTDSRIYLAGPMSGYPEHNFPAFNEAARVLRERGHSVFNPAENVEGRTGEPRSFYMRLDIPALLACDAVVLLPGWRNSRGANLEVWMALDLDMPIHEFLRIDGEVLLERVTHLEPFGLPFQRFDAPEGEPRA